MTKSRISLHAQNREALSVLNKLITELISSRMGIEPEQVTMEYIHGWREQELYPQLLFIM